MRVYYSCPQCGTEQEDTVEAFYEEGWCFNGGPQTGDEMEGCGHTLSQEESAAILEDIARQVAEPPEDDV